MRFSPDIDQCVPQKRLYQVCQVIFCLHCLWPYSIYIVHGTQLLILSKCSVGCPLTVFQFLVQMQVPSGIGPTFDATLCF